MKTPIHFFNEDITFRFRDIIKKRDWLNRSIVSEGKLTGEISFIFCSDAYLLKMNIEYLNHDTLTDVITFDYTEENTISGDIFISIPQVKENAVLFSRPFDNELNRVMVHGVLHLCGYKDKTPARVKQMRIKEDEKLQML